MTIARRVIAGYAGIMLLVLAMMAAGTAILAPLTNDIREYSDLVLAQADAASQTALAVKAMGTNAAIGILGTGTDRSDAVSQVETMRRGALAALQEAASLARQGPVAGRSVDLAAIEGLNQLIDEYHASIMRTLSLGVANQEGARAVLNEEVFPLGAQLDQVAAAYYEGQRARSLAEADGLAHSADVMWISLCVTAALVVLGGLTMSVVIPRSVNSHLRKAVSGMQKTATQMLGIASQVAASAAQSSVGTNETTVTVEEVRQTALLSREKAAHLADSAEQVARIAESSRLQAQGTMATYGRIGEQMDTVAGTIRRLSEQTEAVNAIMIAVSDLAEQSNLLSVNASIEAAKAGDQGRGFAVVAQEVKSLAGQSKQAVAQVGGILDEIRRAGMVAQQAAERGRHTVDDGRSEVARAEEGTLVLADAAAEAAQSAMKISISSQQQLAGMEQISKAVRSISLAGQQSIEGTRQVEYEVRQLQDLSKQLKRLVESDAQLGMWRLLASKSASVVVAQDGE